MEGVGAEISQKIKSAIKAKLMEIGAFVDDELPDYIMVMVANKRTKAQMNDDLSLFLGSNTHHFTSWLHSVLEQLKQVTLISQTAKGLKESSKRKSSANEDSSNESKKRKKESKDTSESQSSSLQTTDITDRIKQELISEFSKESGVTVESTSDVLSKNKSPLENSPKEPGKAAPSDANISDVDLAESSESPKKADAPAAAKKAKHSSEVLEQAHVEKELVTAKETVKNGKKEDNEDREDSLSLELSSDENEYINIKNDDIFLSGDEEVPSHRLSSGKSIPSKISNPKSSDYRSSRNHSDIKESRSKQDKSAEKSRRSSHSRDERKSRDLHSSRDRDVLLTRDRVIPSSRDRAVPSSRDTDRSSSKVDFNPEKKVMDAREVLNWKRTLKRSSVPESEKSDSKSSRSKSIFDRLSNKKMTERSRERIRESSERSQRTPEHTRGRDEASRMTSTRTNVNTSEDRTNRDKRTSDTRQSVAQSKRQVISISQIAESERELLRSAQKVAAVKPQVSSQVSSRSQSSQSSKSQLLTSSRNQSQPRKKEKSGENRLASRVVAKEPDPESEAEEITADVPSVVKVTPRPVIPTSKAAPRNLILKAVAEAEKSVHSSPIRSDKLRNKERGRERIRPKEKFSKTISPACISITLPNDRVGIREETWIDDSEEENSNASVRPSLEVFKKYQSSRGERRLPIRRSPSPESRMTPDRNMNQCREERSEDSASIEFNISENSLPDEDDDELDYQPKKEPSFIVTLNNLDPAIKARAESEESKAVNRVKPQRIFVNTEKLDDSSNESVIPMLNKTVSPVIISVSPSSPESNDDCSLKKTSPVVNKTHVVTTAVPQVMNKVAEICKYWPNCLAGDKCPFVHITTSCVNFPNCKFGTRCLYTHPKCKFLNACVRKNCPYSHPVSSLSLSTPALASQTCKFFPQCKKIGCPYFHPKPCKFGVNCMTKDCVFAHISSSSGNKFKWSKSSSSQPLSVFL